MECAVYGTKYNVKLDAVDTATSLIVAVASIYPHVKRFSGTEAFSSSSNAVAGSSDAGAASSSSGASPPAMHPLADDAEAKGRRMIARLTNKVLGASFFSATYVALVLGGFGDHRKSHDTRIFIAKLFADRCDALQTLSQLQPCHALFAEEVNRFAKHATSPVLLGYRRVSNISRAAAPATTAASVAPEEAAADTVAPPSADEETTTAAGDVASADETLDFRSGGYSDDDEQEIGAQLVPIQEGGPSDEGGR
jgi:hypothetical protein